MKIPESIRTSLEAGLEYLWADEQANYESNPDEPDHVFPHMQVIADWLDGLDNDDDDDDGGGEPLPPTDVVVADCPERVAT